MSENQVVNDCLRWLLANGCYVWRHNSGGYKPEGSKRFIRFGAKGSPDIVGTTRKGQFIGVECKFGKNKPSPEQLYFGYELATRNAIYVVAYSLDDLEEIKDML